MILSTKFWTITIMWCPYEILTLAREGLASWAVAPCPSLIFNMYIFDPLGIHFRVNHVIEFQLVFFPPSCTKPCKLSNASSLPSAGWSRASSALSFAVRVCVILDQCAHSIAVIFGSRQVGFEVGPRTCVSFIVLQFIQEAGASPMSLNTEMTHHSSCREGLGTCIWAQSLLLCPSPAADPARPQMTALKKYQFNKKSPPSCRTARSRTGWESGLSPTRSGL